MYYITSDATCDLPNELSNINKFYKLPMPYSIGDEHFIHGSENTLPIAEFYNRMRNGANPITSCVTPNTAIEKWSNSLKEGWDILHIGFSSGLSSTYKNLLLARDELKLQYPDRKIIVVDSLSASIGEALLIIYAARNRDKGINIEDNAKYVEELKYSINHHFIVNDLFHLKRGGRISHFAALIGTAIQLKPLLKVSSTGHLVASEKAISRKLAIKNLINKVTSSIIEDRTDLIFITHGDCLQDAEEIRMKIISAFPKINVYVNRTGPILLSHTGMGFIGITYIGKDRRE